MIITVTLNAAIDKSLSVPNFQRGRRHRTVEQRTMAGGKGVNIARTLKALGQPVIATGFAGGATGTHIVEQLTEESILNDFVRIDVLTVVDTDGEPLRQAVRAEPDLVSPNVLEAEELVGHEFASEEERLQAVGDICALGPREAIMTLPDGCYAQMVLDGRRRVKRARIEPREPIGKAGSGDAFLAGYLAARYEGRSPDQCLRFGVACGAESTR